MLILSWVSESEISFSKYTFALVTCSVVVTFSIYFPDILLPGRIFSVPQNTSTMERDDKVERSKLLVMDTAVFPGNNCGMLLPIFV